MRNLPGLKILIHENYHYCNTVKITITIIVNDTFKCRIVSQGNCKNFSLRTLIFVFLL